MEFKIVLPKPDGSSKVIGFADLEDGDTEPGCQLRMWIDGTMQVVEITRETEPSEDDVDDQPILYVRLHS